MEQCEFYGEQLPTDMQIDLEWKHSTRFQCFTIAQFQELQRQQMGTPPGPQKPLSGDEGV
jgi:hypothetical protein